ncbi:MAG TPA: tetratricopeptide repeat protein [Xanthobacteraceae bacterium]|nr:tetratricopeptide repeat protein [Xanthobacteraceae bacterium]
MLNELQQHLAEKTAGLDADARRAVYARAREALQNEVRASAPFMPVQTVVARRRELENAIMAVEREAAKADPPRGVTPPPAPKAETPLPVSVEPPASISESEPAPDAKAEDAEPVALHVDDHVEQAPQHSHREVVAPAQAVPPPSEPAARDISIESYELLARTLDDMEKQDRRREAERHVRQHEFHEEEAAPPPSSRRPLLLYAGVLALVLCALALTALLVGFGVDRMQDGAPAQAARPPAPAVLPAPLTPESQLIKGAGFQDAAKEALTHANALLARRDFPRAISAFDDAIRLDPQNASALAGRAFAHWSVGNIDSAIRDYGAAIDRDPANAATRLNRAIAYNRNGEYRLAADDLDRALAVEPTNADALNSRCWARAVLAYLEEALADCNKALTLRPGDTDTLDSRGFVLLRLGRLDRAIADYDAALKAQPKMASALYGRGLAKIGRGDRAGGQEDVTAARAIDPDIAMAFSRYGVR